MPPNPRTQEILKKYSAKIESQLSTYSPTPTYSKDYLQFKLDMSQKLTRYERWAKSLGNIISLKVSEKDKDKIQKYLETAHLDVSPSQALTLSVLSLVGVFLLTLLLGVAFYLINPQTEFTNIFLFVFLGVVAAVFLFYYTYTMPQRLANAWRLKASSQMIPAVLYVVVYMKHTSNLERAIEFAAQHLEGPLALDFKKIFYDVEIGKFSTIKQSLDNYLEKWREYAPEFNESFHLIESSLYEPSETRRVEILEKSLQVILEGVYEKMLKYTRDIRSPLTNIYMLGIVLPTLALALLPLASTLLGGLLQWQHVLIIFNILIPFFVFYLANEVLLKRPGGYGETSVLELNPNYSKFTSKKPWVDAAIIAVPLLIIGFLPFIFQITPLTGALGLQNDYTFAQIGLGFLGDNYIFDFQCASGGPAPCSSDDKKLGPFGPLGVLLSLCVPLSIGLFFSIAYRKKTKELIKARENTKTLEEEFTNSLFQLGNRLGDGVPAEIAFAKVAESTRGQATSNFFYIVNQNIQQLGMSLEPAIFDKKRGAIIYYPSSLIATSMKILVEAVKKGLQIAARSLMSISEYVKNIQKINQRLKDLLAEVVSDMKSNMTFLAPLLAGVVVGLGAMITLILTKLSEFQRLFGDNAQLGGFGSISQITSIFDVASMIPPYFLQITVGLYIVEIIFILTSALVTVDAGRDPLREKNELSKYLKRGILLYLITALISIVALSILATVVLGGLTA